MDSNNQGAIAAQRLLMGLADNPRGFMDPLAPMRDAFRAQEEALSGREGRDGGMSYMTVPF
jgi:hypothetical protein